MTAAEPLLQIRSPRRTLESTELGHAVYVDHVAAGEHERRRLLELGLVPGTRLTPVRRAPLGDPLEVELRGYRLSLRRQEARQIAVRDAPPLHALAPGYHGEASDDRVEVSWSQPPRFALVGNPNAGKSTLFNALSGRHVSTANYPGVTVDQTTAAWRLADGREVRLTDLPGCYSVIGRSPEEHIAAGALLGASLTGRNDGADAVILVLDALALERGLHLLLQLRELNIPLICAVNMMDEAERAGVKINLVALRAHFGVPFVGVVAKKKRGLELLAREVMALLGAQPGGGAERIESGAQRMWSWRWPAPLEASLAALHQSLCAKYPALFAGLSPPRARATTAWLAASAESAPLEIYFKNVPPALAAEIPEGGAHWAEEMTIARYAFIDERRGAFMQRPQKPRARLTDRVDQVLTHPLLGSLVFLALLGFIFNSLFTWSEPVMNGIEGGFAWLAERMSDALPNHWLAELLSDGLVRGVGTMLAFLPQIVLLVFFMSFLESLGYLARAAFLIDRVMRAVGLSGKAFVPMVSGFACAVPAILALRTMESRRDRLLTMMVIPLMSCSARLPVYTLIIAAMYPLEAKVLGLPVSTVMLFAIYVTSTILAMLAAGVLGRTAFRGQAATLVLELPPYRIPAARPLVRTVWRRSQDFLQTAGTTIVVLSAVMWAFLNFPGHVSKPTLRLLPLQEQAQKQSEVLDHSLAGRVGHALEPALAPLGFDWKIGIGLVGSFAAREVFVATMGVIHGVKDEGAEGGVSGLASALRRDKHGDGRPVYTARTGFSLLLFFMIACQCMSTLAVVRRETGSWRWPMFMFSYMSVLAYAVSFVAYQGLGLLGLP